MTDNLRDRIAAAIKQIDDMRACKLSNADIKFMADAVIKELGLRKSSRPNDYGHANYPPGDRYITDWLTND